MIRRGMVGGGRAGIDFLEISVKVLRNFTKIADFFNFFQADLGDPEQIKSHRKKIQNFKDPPGP